ncbi:uncharacterized protein TrAtP1_012203 [Trichoderma atroviride]|uniref:uncharacterized protein n=1 Tax=Hypocrea atroviridis TaxID=63577 RepID=UPI0033239CA4|nr:hypothetical protein TrAtP1_012203 [Trichoderma atroviride]
MAPSSADGLKRSPSTESLSSVSTTSIVFDRIQEEMEKGTASRKARGRPGYTDVYDEDPLKDEAADDTESAAFLGSTGAGLQRRPMDRKLRRILFICAAVFAAAWIASLAVFVSKGSYKHASDVEHDPDADSRGSGKPVTLDQIFDRYWSGESKSLSWIAGPDGEDGLLLEQGVSGKDYLVVEDVRSVVGDATAASDADTQLARSRTLMKTKQFEYAGKPYTPQWLQPSPDQQKVLIGVAKESVWRHSFTAVYFVLDVETQTAEPPYPVGYRGSRSACKLEPSQRCDILYQG